MPGFSKEGRSDNGLFQQRGDGSRGAGGIAVGKLRVRRKAAAQAGCLQRCTGRIKKVEGYNCKAQEVPTRRSSRRVWCMGWQMCGTN